MNFLNEMFISFFVGFFGSIGKFLFIITSFFGIPIFIWYSISTNLNQIQNCVVWLLTGAFVHLANLAWLATNIFLNIRFRLIF